MIICDTQEAMTKIRQLIAWQLGAIIRLDVTPRMNKFVADHSEID